MGVISLTKTKPEITLPDHTTVYSEPAPRSSTTGQITCEVGYFEDQNTNISELGRFCFKIGLNSWLEKQLCKHHGCDSEISLCSLQHSLETRISTAGLSPTNPCCLWKEWIAGEAGSRTQLSLLSSCTECALENNWFAQQERARGLLLLFGGKCSHQLKGLSNSLRIFFRNHWRGYL